MTTKAFGNDYRVGWHSLTLCDLERGVFDDSGLLQAWMSLTLYSSGAHTWHTIKCLDCCTFSVVIRMPNK